MLSKIDFTAKLSKSEQQQIKGGIVRAPIGGGGRIKEEVGPAGYVKVTLSAGAAPVVSPSLCTLHSMRKI